MDKDYGIGSRKVVNREISDPNVGDATRSDHKSHDANPDAITGAPGSHPVGTGVGAAAAGAAGAAIGSLIPGIGTAIGGVVGAVVGAVGGGYAGKAVAESINPTDEDAYWRAEHKNRNYYDQSLDYDTDYGPAYRTGVEHLNRNPQHQYTEAEADLQQQWQINRGSSRLDWDRAKLAMRDVYDRNRSQSSSGSRPNLD
jgi:hypothetical protein